LGQTISAVISRADILLKVGSTQPIRQGVQVEPEMGFGYGLRLPSQWVAFSVYGCVLDEVCEKAD
jgi:hypothetical protein